MNPSRPHPHLIAYLQTSYRLLAANARLYWACVALVLLGAILAAYGRSPKFETSAKLMVKLDLQSITLSPAEVRYNLAHKMADEAVGTQVELLNSSDLIQSVIDEVGENVLEGKPKTGLVALIMKGIKGVQNTLADALVSLRLVEPLSPRQQLAKTIRLGLKIQPARKSQTIDIRLRLKNREAAQTILTSLIHQYQQKQRTWDSNPQEQQEQQHHLAQVQQQLAEKEAAVYAFKQQHGFIDLEQEKTNALTHYQHLRSTLEGVISLAQIKPSPAAGASSASGKTPLTGTNDAPELASRLSLLRIELQGRSAIYAAGHSKLTEISDQITLTENLLTAKINALNTATLHYLALSQRLDGLTPQYQNLQRAVEVQQQLYRTLLSATEAQGLTHTKDSQPDILIIDPPHLPEAPVGPSRLILVLGGLGGGLALGVIVVLGLTGYQRKR